MKNRSIAFSERQEEMINNITNEIGLKNPSAVVHYAIAELHRTLFPAYKTSGSAVNTIDSKEKKIKSRLEDKEIEKKIIEDRKMEVKRNICINNFKGNIVGDQCHYTSYGTEEKFDIKEVLELYECDEDIAENVLFVPTKNAVLKARPQLIKKLNL